MAEFTSHAPGTFSWPELATTDQKAGVAFYRALFGWDVSEVPMGPTETYSMLGMRDKAVGAAYTMRPDEQKMGIPPHWNSYVTVADVDDVAETLPLEDRRGAEVVSHIATDNYGGGKEAAKAVMVAVAERFVGITRDLGSRLHHRGKLHSACSRSRL